MTPSPNVASTVERARPHQRAGRCPFFVPNEIAYTLHAGRDRLDAAILLATRFGFERRDRLASTREAVRRELVRGPLVYRYSTMDGEEITFLACAFWLVEAFALLGDIDAARRQMDALLAAIGDNLGLVTEQMDARSGGMLGNAPQALSHLALIHSCEFRRRILNAVALHRGPDAVWT